VHDEEPPAPAPPKGLTDTEVRELRARWGANTLTETRPTPARRWSEPTLVLLGVAATASLAAGEWADALAVVVAAAASVIAGARVEARGARAIEALRARTRARARAIREGDVRELPAEDLVPGDVVLLEEGDRVPADAVLDATDDLAVDTATFTGESAPSELLPGDPVQAGTSLVRGRARATVVATGAHTELARLGRMLDAPSPPSLRDGQIRRLVRTLGVAAASTCLAVLALHLLAGDVRGGIAAAVAVAIAVLPEELPVVRGVLLAVSAWRLGGRGVLVRRLSVLDGVGAIDVVAVDKTGTLTLGRMHARCVWAHGDPPEACGPESPRALAVLRAAAGASESDSHEGTDTAILAGAGGGAPRARRVADWPHRPGSPVHAHAWEYDDGTREAVCKGAPEAVFTLCGGADPDMDAALRALTARGLRVLAVARADAPPDSDSGPRWPADPRALAWRPLGLVGLEDPLHPSAARACADLHRMGVRTVMLTGDHPDTARAHLRHLGIGNETPVVVTGAEVDTLDAPALAARAARADAFARVRPEQKVRVIEALRAGGARVAMTGDGVNDAPALRVADAGFAVRGATDVARAAAPLVLAVDDLRAVADALREGRRVADATRSLLGWLLATHLPVAAVLLAPLTGGPRVESVLAPLHVALLELLVDPAAAFAFASAAPAPDLATRPPEPDPRTAPLLPPREVYGALARAALTLVAVAALTASCRDPGGRRLLALGVLALAPCAWLVGARAPRAAAACATLAVAGLLLALAVPALRDVLQVAPPPAAGWAGLVGALLLFTLVEARRVA
jgi:Ca2+-transporting ATPase